MNVDSAIDRIATLATRANGARVIQIPGGPSHVTMLEDREGQIRSVEALPPLRAYKAFSLDGLAEQLLSIASKEDAAVFVGREAVVAVFNEDEDRRNLSTVSLTRSEAFASLCKLEEASKIAQQDLVLELRTTFAHSFGPDSFLPVVRKLKFSRSTDGASDVQHGRESMGKQVTAEVSGVDGAIPEEVTFTVPVYDQVEFLASVRCAVHVDVVEAAFVVKPLGGEIEKALREANAHMAQHLMTRLGGWVVLPESQFGVRP